MQVLKTTFKAIFLLALLFSISSFSAIEPDPIEGDSFQILQGDIFRNKSIECLQSGDKEGVVENIQNYIFATGDFEILNNSAYEDLYEHEGFAALRDKYLVELGALPLFYLYVGFIGIFIAFVLNIRRKRTDKIANGLIGFFVFIHSIFLIHVCINLINYHYQVPHTQSISGIFSFLYGPVLYFYFKRITQNYVFKKSDIVHLLPTLAYIIVFTPIYLQSSEEKFQMMLGIGSYEAHPYAEFIVIIKLIILLVYGYFTARLYFNNYAKSKKETPKKNRLQLIIVCIHGVYSLSYAIYGYAFLTAGVGGLLFEIHLVAMTVLVLYIGYIAYANPQVLVGTVQAVKKQVVKYRNSGLTTSFSNELKEELERLLTEEKVYRQNSIKLETIAQRLGTTRHNASQVINEHFGLNFFELINKYRVEEAMELLKSNKENLNIIDIAYEVGYNNKVTFNKSFKRFSNLTPSQFMKLEKGVA